MEEKLSQYQIMICILKSVILSICHFMGVLFTNAYVHCGNNVENIKKFIDLTYST